MLSHRRSATPVWGAFANAMGSDGIPDLWLMVLAMAAFGCGFVLGLFNFGRIAGIAALGALGGLSIGVRVILFRPGLLIPSPFWANWTICGVLGAVTFLLCIAKQRAAIVRRTFLALSAIPADGLYVSQTICSAAVGTFLTGLGADLLVNKQGGMSMGLRHLFDRNSAHILYMKTHDYSPSVITEVIMAVSLVLM